MEFWRAVDIHSGGLQTKMESWRVYIDKWSQIPITLMRSRIRIRIKVKSWIRIRIKVKIWIRPHLSRSATLID